MSPRKQAKRNHLRLVRSQEAVERPHTLTNPVARQEFEQLTQRLVDISIEILDITGGDPDIELNGDEREDGDPAEDSDGV